MAGNWRELYNEQPYNLYSSSDVIKVMGRTFGMYGEKDFGGKT